jgi:protein involved in polysaccharide export with SLBB domain
LVTRREVITNSVIVGGEVVKPGRLVLNTNQESLSDVVALAGGIAARRAIWWCGSSGAMKPQTID